MARRPREATAGRVYHLAQLGHNGQAFLRDDIDREQYFRAFCQSALGRGLIVHGWCLLESEAHWMVCPQRNDALSAVLQQTGRRYVRHFNGRWALRGSPWEGRYRSYWIDAQAYGLELLSWLEWRPLQLGLGEQLLAWRWTTGSLVLGHRQQSSAAPFRPIDSYWQLGNTPFEREARFSELIRDPPDQLPDPWQHLRSARPMLGEQLWARLPEAERELWISRPRGRPTKPVSVPN
ncbi:MAG: transposase [Burkholderiaceae bacterium]